MHQRTASEVDREENLVAFTSFNRIQFHDGNIKIDGSKFQEIFTGFFANPVPNLSGKAYSADRQKPCIDVVVDLFFIKHNFICILDAYVIDCPCFMGQ